MTRHEFVEKIIISVAKASDEEYPPTAEDDKRAIKDLREKLLKHLATYENTKNN